MGALSIFSSCKGKDGPMNIVAREYALDIGECAFAPELIQHIPGATNMIADLLSRRTDPKYAAAWAVP